MQDNLCPNCHNLDLVVYDPLEWDDSENGSRIVRCLFCGFVARAWYEIKFTKWEYFEGEPKL